MSLGFKLTQKLSQSLVMTPQLQRAIKMLQLSRKEYLEVLENELLENPVLEDLRDGNAEVLGGKEGLGEVKSEVSVDEVPVQESLSVNELYPVSGQSSSGDQPASYENYISQPEDLYDHLWAQIGSLELDERGKVIAGYIIGNLNIDGMLEHTVKGIAEDCQATVEEVEGVLLQVQTLEPVGIASRDLRECLLLQLTDLGQREMLPGVLVEKYFDNLIDKKYAEILKLEKVTTEEIKKAVEVVKSLSPRPGRSYAVENPSYVSPDVYVVRARDGYKVVLNDGDMPRLGLRDDYSKLLDNGGIGDDGEKKYIQGCLKSANWLLRIIEQRQRTIYRVTKCVMEHQSEFLEKGVEALKPLILKDVSSVVELHESTVSRVTTNKYVHTPHGVFELKYFFSSSLRSNNGDVSAESVKLKIKDVIDSEDKKKPLSDQAISKVLENEGIKVARRTVAKYRELLGILSSSQRRNSL